MQGQTQRHEIRTRNEFLEQIFWIRKKYDWYRPTVGPYPQHTLHMFVVSVFVCVSVAHLERSEVLSCS